MQKVTKTPSVTPPQAAAEIPPPLDLTVIATLRAWSPQGAGDPVAHLTAAFLADAHDRLQKMNAAIAAGDEVAARKAAHSLKGMSGAIGALHLSTLSAKVEYAEPGAIDRARLEQLEREFERVSQALKAA